MTMAVFKPTFMFYYSKNVTCHWRYCSKGTLYFGRLITKFKTQNYV